MDTVYFAYGSNMSRAQMKYRCPGAAALGRAALPGYRFVINRRGVATVVLDPAGVVHGALWRITTEHERTLDRYEGVADGLYTRERLMVEPAGGKPVEALVYVAADGAAGAPRRGYLDIVLRGAGDFELPAAYLAELKSWASAD